MLAAAVAMILALTALPWYRRAGATVDGWTGAPHLRWLLVVATAVGVFTVVSQAACRAPALPASLDVVSLVVALAALVWLVVDVVIDSAARADGGAWLALGAACGLLGGSFVALRQEGIPARDGPQTVAVVDLRPSPRAPGASPS